jgi:hypothetical protein
MVVDADRFSISVRTSLFYTIKNSVSREISILLVVILQGLLVLLFWGGVVASPLIIEITLFILYIYCISHNLFYTKK